MGRLRPIALFCASWAALFCVALLLFGTWSGLNLMASGAVGLAAAAAAAATAYFASPRFGLRLRWLRVAAAVPQRTFVDFWILTRELALSFVRGAPREGVFRAKPFDAGGSGAALSSGWRAFVGLAAGFSPNAYVVEIDPERRQVLVHDLVPDERSEAPA